MFVGTFTGGSRWIIGNPFVASDVNITLVRMFNNNDASSVGTGKLIVTYVSTASEGISIP